MECPGPGVRPVPRPVALAVGAGCKEVAQGATHGMPRAGHVTGDSNGLGDQL